MAARQSKYLWCLATALFLCSLFVKITPAQADLTYGKKYDQTNYQEIQDLLFPALLNWVKNGRVTLKTGQLEFEWEKSAAFLEASLKNDTKFEISKEGVLAERNTGKPPNFVYGFPFPRIDPQDPQAAAKIMENHSAQLFSMGSHHVPSHSRWVGANGEIQRKVTSDVYFLFYQQRRQEQLPNPDNLLFQQMIQVVEPFKLKGSNQMIFAYSDLRKNSGLAYLPSTRRVRKISTADSSSPRLGSDVATDDNYGWIGKNSTMKWRLIGEKILLMPFSSAKKIVVKEFPDGSIDRIFPDLKLGHEVPGWQGAPWYPVDAVWSPISFWIVEAKPKDPNYFYGRQILYIDKGTYTCNIKEIFDQNEQYWKTIIDIGSYQVTATGTDMVGAMDFGVMVDDRNQHSTYLKVVKLTGVDHRMHLPISVLGPQNFTEDAFIQTTK